MISAYFYKDQATLKTCRSASKSTFSASQVNAKILRPRY
jgi:hypothetical protein